METRGNAGEVPVSSLEAPDMRLHVSNLPLAGMTDSSLAGQAAHAGSSAQDMIDEVVGRCIIEEQSGSFHEPDVEDELPPAGVLPPDSAQFKISTPVGSGAVPMEHDLILPPSTLQKTSAGFSKNTCPW